MPRRGAAGKAAVRDRDFAYKLLASYSEYSDIDNQSAIRTVRPKRQTRVSEGGLPF